MKKINPKAIDMVMEKLLSPVTGLTPDGSINQTGLETVLELRSQYGGRILSDTSKYLNLELYNQIIEARNS